MGRGSDLARSRVGSCNATTKRLLRWELSRSCGRGKTLREELTTVAFAGAPATGDFAARLIGCIRVNRKESKLSIACRSQEERTEDVEPSVLHSFTSGGGGGSRTRVRKPIGSASTSLVPHFDLNAHAPVDKVLRIELPEFSAMSEAIHHDIPAMSTPKQNSRGSFARRPSLV
jgi:hypothetical protein